MVCKGGFITFRQDTAGTPKNAPTSHTLTTAPGGHSTVRREHSGARGAQAVADDLLRLEAGRGGFDTVALALDDGEGDLLGVVRFEVLVDTARVGGAVVHLSLAQAGLSGK